MAKKEEMEEVAPGIFKANSKTYYIKCAVSQKLCFCSKERLDKLSKKYNGIKFVSENYISRDAKRLQKVGTNHKAIAKMNPDDLSEESRIIHEEKQKKKALRKEKREKEEALEKTKQLHVDPYLVVYGKDELEKLTSEKGCLRYTYRTEWGRCNKCMYQAHCKAEMKVMIWDIPADKMNAINKIVAKHTVPVTLVEKKSVAQNRKVS